MRPVLALAVVELRRFLADRFNLFFVFVLPLALVLVLGLQSTDPPSTRVSVTGAGVVAADDQLLTSLTERLEATGLEVTELDDLEQVEDAVGAGRAEAGVVLTSVDPLAVEVLDAGEPSPQADLLVRAALTDLTAAEHRVSSLTGAGLPEAQVRAALADAPAGQAQVVVAGESTPLQEEFAGLDRFALGAGGQLLLFVFLNTLTAASAMIQARRNGVLRRTMAAPLTSLQAVTGLTLGRFVIAVFQGAYIMGASSLLFGVDWGNLAVAILVLAVFALIAAGTALIIGVVMDAEGPASGVAVGAGMILAALGGCMVPLEFFPDTLRTVAHLTPHAWAYDALAEVQRRGGGVVDILPELAVLAAMAAALLAAGALLLRRTLQRAL